MSADTLQRQANPWRTLSRERKYEDDFFAVDEHQVLDAAGNVKPYGVIHHKKRGLRVLPVDDDGSVFLVGQFRYGAQYYSWELPAGGDETGEDPKAAAARELREEAGLEAEHWLELLRHVPSGSLADAREITYLTWGLTAVKADPDEQEVLQVRRVPLVEAVRLALGGGILDSGSVASILALQIKLQAGELPSQLSECLSRKLVVRT